MRMTQDPLSSLQFFETVGPEGIHGVIEEPGRQFLFLFSANLQLTI